jgi:RNA polymerase sigma-70 factor (ECF subfamily)
MESGVFVNLAKDSGGTGAAPSSFPATQWSMVVSAGAGTDTQARAALEQLCRMYWQPLYVFVRRQGRDHHDAEDATQQFIAHLLAADGLQGARPERGLFRTFLLTALRNFLISDWRRTQAAKRGGGVTLLNLQSHDVKDSIGSEPTDPSLTPERAFDRSWAHGLVERAATELQAEYNASGREKIFAQISSLIWGTDSTDAIVAGAAALGLTPNAFRVAVHRARRRLGERLRAHVAETVADPREIDVELRHLMDAISGPNGTH